MDEDSFELCPRGDPGEVHFGFIDQVKMGLEKDWVRIGGVDNLGAWAQQLRPVETSQQAVKFILTVPNSPSIPL